MYVTLDKDTQQLVLKIPPKYEEYTPDLMRDLMEEFRFDALNTHTLNKINDFIKNWFSAKGVDLTAG